MMENASARSGPCERGELIRIILSILSLPALTGPLFFGRGDLDRIYRILHDGKRFSTVGPFRARRAGRLVPNDLLDRRAGRIHLAR